MKDNALEELHSKYPTVLIKKSLKRRIKRWDLEKDGPTLMMRILFDALIDKEKVKNYSLKELLTKEKTIMTAIFHYVTSAFKLTSDSKLRSSLSDKLSHLPGRTRKVRSELQNGQSTSNAATAETDVNSAVE